MKNQTTDSGQSYFLALAFPPQIAADLEARMVSVARHIDGVIVQPAASLHISMLDFVDPFTSPTLYGFASKAAVWQEIGPACQAAVHKAIKNLKPFTITFGELIVTDVAIILKGQDDGQIQKLREDIMAEIAELRLPNSKRPPAIIHSSLARFSKGMPLEPIRKAVAADDISFTLQADTLYIRHQVKMNMLESEVVEVYDLR